MLSKQDIEGMLDAVVSAAKNAKLADVKAASGGSRCEWDEAEEAEETLTELCEKTVERLLYAVH